MDLVALQKISYGVYIVGSYDDKKLNAQIANSVMQITSEPATIAVSINKKNLTHDYIKESRVFSVSILCQNTPLPFIGNFGFRSGRDVNKFKNVKFKTGQTGSPIVMENATAFLEAEVRQDIEAGTHTIFIGKVLNAGVLTEEPVLTYEYYHQVKRGTTPKTAPSYININ